MFYASKHAYYVLGQMGSIGKKKIEEKPTQRRTSYVNVSTNL